MSQIKVVVTLKPALLDAQGRVVRDALHSLGHSNVSGVRIGKYMEIEMESDPTKDMQAEVREMCDKLLANPVIENYTFEVTE